MDNLKSFIDIVLKKGILSIFSANVVNKIVSMLVNILIITVLSQKDYGYFCDSNNIYSIFILLNGMGVLSGVLLYGSESRTDEEKYKYYKYAFIVGILFNIILGIGLFLYGYFEISHIRQSNKYIMMFGFMPIMDFLVQFFQALMRCRKENNRYAFLLNFNTVSYSIFTLIGAYINGVVGAVIGRYISAMLSMTIGLCFSKKIVAIFLHSDYLIQKEKKGFLSYSIGTGFGSAVGSALYLVDVFLVGQLLANEVELAKYKVATLIPDNLNIIPLSIIVALLPFFAEHNTEKKWLIANLKRLISVCVLINFIIVLILFLISRWLILFLWGDDYVDSITYFRILCISFFFIGSFRLISSNVLSMLRKVKETLIISIVSLITNVVLDYIFICKFAAIGAAMATLMVSIVASGVSLGLLVKAIKEM